MVTSTVSDPRLTPDGAAWLAKALHPADVTLDVHGVPTLEGVPTATLDYMTTQTIAAPGAAAWGAEVLLNPNPMYFGKVITSTAAPAYGSTTVYNPTLTTTAFSEFGAGAKNWHAAALASWTSNVLRYRMLYASVTVTMSASSTTNQGTVVAGQYPKTGDRGYSAQAVDFTQNPTTVYMARKVVCYDVNRPNTTALQQIRGSCSWDAKEGVYQILKMDESALEWRNVGSLYIPMGMGPPSSSVRTLVQGKDAVDFFGYAAAGANDTLFGPVGSWARQLPSGTGATTATPFNGAAGGTNTMCHMLPCSTNMGHMIFQGLDPAATLMMTFRVGFEVVVPPGSVYNQSVTMPVRYDPLALESYYRASREMMSAYPAKYNIFGAVLPFLKKAGEFILPKVGNFAKSLFGVQSAPPQGPSLSQATTVGAAMTPLAPAPAPQYAPPQPDYRSYQPGPPREPRRPRGPKKQRKPSRPKRR